MSTDNLSGVAKQPPVPGSQCSGSSQPALRGNLGTLALVMTVIAFNGPIVVLCGLVPVIIGSGNGLATPATFITMGVLTVLFAVGLNAMASRMTHAGAFYTYVTAGIGRRAGLSAGAIAMIAYITLNAGVIALFGVGLEHLLTSVFHVDGGPPWWVWALACWAAVTVLSLFNVELSAKVLGIASMAEIVITVVWNFRVYANGGPEGRHVDVLGNYFSGSLALALVFGVLCLTGFESLQVFRAETNDPNRTVPRATYISVALLVGLYSVSAYAFIVAYGPSKAIDAAADPTGAILSSMGQYVAAPAADIANVLLLSSSFASILAIQNTLARYLFAIGRDGVLPARFGVANAKHGSPMFASAVGGIATLVVFGIPTLAGVDGITTFATMTGVGAFAVLLLWLATSIAVVMFFFRHGHGGVSAIKVYVIPVIASIGLTGIIALAVVHFNDILGQPTYTLAAIVLAFIVVVVIAAALAAEWYRRNRPEVYETIGHQSDTV